MRLPSRATVRRVLLALLVVELLYVVGANLFLASAVGRRLINLREERLRIDYDRALTPWPGMVWARGLRLRGQSPRIQWMVEGERASGRISLLPLVLRSFRVSHLRATGITMLLRRRLDAVGEATAAPELQPQIPGLENPPVRKPELLYGTRPPESSWTVTLSGCRFGDVREVWLEDYRLLGEMEVGGGMRMRLKRTMTVRRSRAALHNVELRVGDRVVATGLDGEIRASSKEFRHRENRGVAALGFFTGKLELGGRLESLGFLNFYLREAPWLRFVEGGGELVTDVALEDGSFTPGSSFTLQPARFAATVLADRATGNGRIAWDVGEAEPRRWQLVGELDSFSIQRQGHETPHVSGEGLRLEARGERLFLPEAFRGVEVVADLPSARVPDLTFYNSYLPEGSGLSILQGSGTIQGRLEASTASGQTRGELELRSPGVEIEFEDVALSGDLTVKGVFPEADLRRKEFSLDGSEVVLEDARVTSVEKDQDEWWARLSVEDGLLTPGRPTMITADFRAGLLDSRPALTLISARKELPNWVEKVVRVRDLSASGSARLGKGLLEIDDLLMSGDKLEVRGRVRRQTPARHDLLYVRYGIFRLGVELEGAEAQVKVVRPLHWYERRLQELVGGTAAAAE